MLPEIDGLEVCRILKKRTQDQPYTYNYAHGQKPERVNKNRSAWNWEQMTTSPKPFSVKELIARIKALLRRMNPETKQAEIIKIGEVTIDFSKYLVTQKGKPIELTTRNLNFSKALISAADGLYHEILY